jgi:hypothetical protein
VPLLLQLLFFDHLERLEMMQLLIEGMPSAIFLLLADDKGRLEAMGAKMMTI